MLAKQKLVARKKLVSKAKYQQLARTLDKPLGAGKQGLVLKKSFFVRDEIKWKLPRVVGR